MNYFKRETAEEPRVLGYQTVAEVSAEARAGFYQKVYSLFLLGFVVVALFASLGTWLTMQGIITMQVFYGLIIFEVAIAWFAGSQLKSKKATLALMMLYAAVTGLTFGPLCTIAMQVAMANGMAPYTLIIAAFGITTVAFGGLTAYVFISKQDFSYLGGFLSMMFTGVLVFVLLSWIGVIQMTRTMDLAFCSGFLFLMSINVLYVTSKIQHHYGPQHTVFAAFELLMSFVLMLWYVLRLLIILYGGRR